METCSSSISSADVLCKQGHQVGWSADIEQCNYYGKGFAFSEQLLAKADVAQMDGGEIDQGHDFPAGEMGKPLTKGRENCFDQKSLVWVKTAA